MGTLISGTHRSVLGRVGVWVWHAAHGPGCVEQGLWCVSCGLHGGDGERGHSVTRSPDCLPECQFMATTSRTWLTVVVGDGVGHEHGYQEELSRTASERAPG